MDLHNMDCKIGIKVEAEVIVKEEEIDVELGLGGTQNLENDFSEIKTEGCIYEGAENVYLVTRDEQIQEESFKREPSEEENDQFQDFRTENTEFNNTSKETSASKRNLKKIMSRNLQANEEIGQMLGLDVFDSDDGFDTSDDDSVIDPLFSSSDSVSSSEDEVDAVSLGEMREENISIQSASFRNNRAASDSMTENFSLDKNTAAVTQTIQKGAKRCKTLVWKKKNLILTKDQQKFRGKGDLPSSISNLEAPYDFFIRLFPESLLDYITSQTLLYSVQKDPSSPLDITKEDIRKYLGICLVMSYVYLPSIRDYWSDCFGIKLIIETMSLNHFEKIRKYFHFSNNDAAIPLNDRLFKVRPIINELRKNFRKVPMEEYLSVVKQPCPAKCRSYSKLHKWGSKFFVLCGASGYVYDFEIGLHTDKKNDASRRLGHEPDFGASSNVMARLCRKIPRNYNFKICFDRFYTSVPLMVYLANKGIYSLGTIKRNRIPNDMMPSSSEMKKRGRGASTEMITTTDYIDISCVAWQDSKLVMLLSTFAGELPLSKVERFDKSQKCTLPIACPAVVKQYNKHMEGVELLDSLLGRNENRILSTKWYFRIFYHLLDMTVVNSWLLSKRVHGNTINLEEFRDHVAEWLCKIGIRNVSKRVRSSIEVEPQLQEKKKRSKVAQLPVKNIRCDNVDHWPDRKARRLRCKMPLCKALTYIQCSKCGVSLCLNKEKNCFTKFHTI